MSAPVRTEPALPALEPQINRDTERFWAATLEGHLLLAVCPTCERVIWYPKPLCAACGGTPTQWRPASGRGVVHSFTVVRRGLGTFGDCGPYVIAFVELEEGPRVLTNLVDVDVDRVVIGQPVRLVFDLAGPHAALYRFTAEAVK
ncbi:MAG TPA: OB-fold domain-containing protein [Micromonosporaceae bacterium]